MRGLFSKDVPPPQTCFPFLERLHGNPTSDVYQFPGLETTRDMCRADWFFFNRLKLFIIFYFTFSMGGKNRGANKQSHPQFCLRPIGKK